MFKIETLLGVSGPVDAEIGAMAVAKRCDKCQHVYDDRDPDDSLPDPIYRCGYVVPFWVPIPVHDYKSWVKADDGAKCQAFAKKQRK